MSHTRQMLERMALAGRRAGITLKRKGRERKHFLSRRMLFSSPDHSTGQCTGPRRGIIIPHRTMLAENGVAPWMEAKPAPLEAGACLGQTMSANPLCYAAGTFYKSVT